MSTHRSSQIDQVCEQVERLLARHASLQHQNELLEARLELLTQQRDALEARLTLARARIDALLARLPIASGAASDATPPANAAVP